jgi:hypothetical protein
MRQMLVDQIIAGPECLLQWSVGSGGITATFAPDTDPENNIVFVLQRHESLGHLINRKIDRWRLHVMAVSGEAGHLWKTTNDWDKLSDGQVFHKQANAKDEAEEIAASYRAYVTALPPKPKEPADVATSQG